MARSRTTFWKHFFNFVSFVALALIGIALALAYFISGNKVSGAFATIAEILAYIVVIFFAFIYAWKGGADRNGKIGIRQVIQLAIWLAATILVVVFMIL